MPLKTICKYATSGPGMLSDDNGRKSVNLCCRSRPDLVEGVMVLVVRDDILRGWRAR
jgi:hypothetical protein